MRLQCKEGVTLAFAFQLLLFIWLSCEGFRVHLLFKYFDYDVGF